MTGVALIRMLTDHFRAYKNQTQQIRVEIHDLSSAYTYTIKSVQVSPTGPLLTLERIR
jgi:hypothetical protein